MYGKSYRSEVFTKRYRELAEWVLAHQGYFEPTPTDVAELVQSIDDTVHAWLWERTPRKFWDKK